MDKGDIKIVADQWAKDWQAVEALKIMENALTRTDNKVDAVVASNDGTAGGAIQALAEQKLAGKVLVSGQDADLAACQRIVAGTQTMTIYKPIKLARPQGGRGRGAAGARSSRSRDATQPRQQRQEGRAQHPARARSRWTRTTWPRPSSPTATRSCEDVYKDVPKEQWPKQ